MNRDTYERMSPSISKKARERSNADREKISKKLFLGEIVDMESPEFGSNNLILAPVGSGKSYLIENKLIPEGYSGKILYLTSSSALKDSIAPNDNILRKEYAENGKSKGFFTSQNKSVYGNVDYKVHVMTYHEFGNRIFSPNEKFTQDINLIFCDEIHSLPIFTSYGGRGSGGLVIALRWLFGRHEDKEIYYFTATNESISGLEAQMPGFLSSTKVFDYLEYPNIVKYQARSKYYISNDHQLKVHLEAKLEYVNYNLRKGLAFTRRIESQRKISEIAEEAGYRPIILWSVNNEDNQMSDEQLRVRDFLLNTGNIPEPYNLLIINGSMQEGWNLNDKAVEFAILDTLDKTEQVQALGRIRKDIDFLLMKVKGDDIKANGVQLESKYLNRQLTTDDKDVLVKDLNLKNDRGNNVKWPTVKRTIISSGYKVEDLVKTIDGKRRGVSIITE